MKDIKVVGCGSDTEVFEDENTINIEFFLEGADVNEDVVDQITRRIDNYYDANGLTDIVDDSYFDGNEMVWKIELFFNGEGYDGETLAQEIQDYIENLVITGQV